LDASVPHVAIHIRRELRGRANEAEPKENCKEEKHQEQASATARLVRSFEYYVDYEKIECIQKEELKEEEMGGGNISPMRKNKLGESSQIEMKEISGAGDSSQQNGD
jgi:hypothetical protein